MLVISNFSFSHNVFHSNISLVCQNVVLCGNSLTASKCHYSQSYFSYSHFCRTIVLQCYHCLRIAYLAYYVFGKSRANLPPIKNNFSVSNAFLRQPAV